MELANLGLALVILVLPYFMVKWTRGRVWPSVIAVLYTVLAIILSGFMYHEGQGFGPYLMITVFYFPALLLYGWIGAHIARWWVLRRAANTPLQGPVQPFGRQ